MNWCYLRGEREEANIWPLGEAETAESAENALFMSVNFVPQAAQAAQAEHRQPIGSAHF